MRIKRILAALLSAALLAGMCPIHALAVNTTDFYARAKITKDSTVSYQGQDSVVVAFQVKGAGIKETQSLSLAYDSTLFALLDSSGTSVQDALPQTLTQYPAYAAGEGDFTVGQTAFAVSGDKSVTYVLLQPRWETQTDGLAASEFATILTFRLGLQAGKTFGSVTPNAVRLLTRDEANLLNQSSIAIVNDGQTAYKYGTLNGTDTLDEPEVLFDGVIPPKPDYTGTEAVAPVVSAKKGGAVTLTAQSIAGETVEYAWSEAGDAAPEAGWQSELSFADVTAGTRYFWARVAEGENHAAGKAVSTKVTVFAAPTLWYAAIDAMSIGVSIPPLSPTIEGGAGATSDSFAVTGGTLPAGLTLHGQTGVVSGAPTAAANAGAFTVTFTDLEGQTAACEVQYGAAEKLPSTLTIAAVADVVYGNAPIHGAPTQNTAGVAVTYTYSRSLSGSYGAWSAANPVGEYWAKGSTPETEAYLSATSAPVSFRVLPAPLSGSVSVAGAPAYGETLTASAHDVLGTPAYQWYRGDTKIAGATGNSYTVAVADVGSTLTVKVRDSAGNYDGTVQAVTATVQKAAAVSGVTGQTVVVSSEHDKDTATTYTYSLSGLAGLPADLMGRNYTGVRLGENSSGMLSAPTLSGETLGFTVSPKPKNTEATLLVTISSANYQDITAVITVTAVDKQIVAITMDNASVVYDGAAHALTPVWPAAANGQKTVTYAKDGASPTVEAPRDAGSYTVTAVYEDAVSYGTQTALLTITPREAVLVWSGDQNLMYDGTAKNVQAAVYNLVVGDACIVTVTGGTASAVGTHTATATGLSNPNYALPAAVTHSYTIAPQSGRLTVELSQSSFIYNGAEQKPAVTVTFGAATLAENTDYTIVWPADCIGAGEKTVSVSGVGNYDGASGTAVYQIVDKPDAPAVTAQAGNGSVTVRWSEPAYHGSPITAYQVRQGSEAAQSVDAAARSYRFTGLDNGTSYTFYVVAINAVGESAAGTVTATPVASSGGGGGGGAAQPPKEKVEISTDSMGQVDVKVPVETDKNGASALVISDEDGKRLLDAVDKSGDAAVVVSTKTATDTDKVTLSLPAAVAGGVSAAGGSLTAKNPLACITLGDQTLRELAQKAKESVHITAERRGDAIALTVAADRTVQTVLSGGVTAMLPARTGGAGDVAVLVHEDGTEMIIQKSAIVDGRIIAVLPGSAVVKVISNAAAFADMENHWAKNSVDFVSARELFNGTGAGRFSPDAAMNRGMLITTLYRLEGAATDAADTAFTDVATEAWYAAPVRWGVQQGIVTGMGDGRFVPEGAVSREMLSVMLYRYCGGASEAPSAAMDAFRDRGQVSGWAEQAMQWAVASGIIGGRGDGTLAPQEGATRAEVSAMLQRVVEYLLK